MKEKAEVKRLSDQLDALNHKRPSVIQAGNAENINEIDSEIETLKTEIERLKEVLGRTLSKKAQQLKDLPFSRAITKKEQADMGALKKLAPGIQVVHPMTALGREMGVKEVTGYARKAF